MYQCTIKNVMLLLQRRILDTVSKERHSLKGYTESAAKK